MNSISVINLCKTYGKGEMKVEALKNVSFDIKHGEFVTIIGPSGSGKSTLLNLMGALDYPTAGKVVINNEDITGMKEEELAVFRRRHIGFVFQSFHLVPELNVIENIIFPLLLDRKKPDMNYIEGLVEQLGLSQRKHHLPNQLSGGQQQRVAIGRALAAKPALILADEPTGNLDTKSSNDVIELLKKFVNLYNQTLIMITHNQTFSRFADRVILLRMVLLQIVEVSIMKRYIEIAGIYLKAHAKRTKLTILSISAAVTLVVTIISMLDSVLLFERTRVLKSEGNYHILIRNASEQEKQTVIGRNDVQSAGNLIYYGEGQLNNEPCALASIDEQIAANLNFNLIEGAYPINSNEIMVEQWFSETIGNKHTLGDQVYLTLPDGQRGQFKISGIYQDLGATKATGIAGVILSQKAAIGLTTQSNDFFIQFKNKVNIQSSMDNIIQSLAIPTDRVAKNERLLALTLQSKNNRVLGIYALGTVLFFLVLTTALVMIYNTFHISVMECTRFFGIIRCIGTSKRQIWRIVMREGLILATIAIPIGEVLGFVFTTLCTGFLKIFNSTVYAELPLLHPSLWGMLVGVLLGYLAIYLAVKNPAKKASRTTPLYALAGLDTLGIKKRKKHGWLTALFRIEVATGIQNAIRSKKTFALMCGSISMSIIIFMGFSVLVDPQYLGMSAVKNYTADISIQNENGIDGTIMKKLSEDESVKRVFGRKSGYYDVTFDYERLTPWYQTNADITQAKDGLFIAEENAFVISYNTIQLKWAKSYLSSGTTDPNQLYKNHGIIAVEKNWRKNSYYKTNNLKIGDKVHVKTSHGEEIFTVMGVCDTIPYHTQSITLCTFILTEEQFNEISNNPEYTTLDLQLKNKQDDKAVNQIKTLVEADAKFLDRRQLNDQAKSAFLTMAAFIYGFAGIVALISVFNLFNTMNTSVISRTRYYGVMRALGITGRQLTLMVFTEALVYGLGGAMIGFLLGTLFQKVITDFLQGYWKAPLLQYLVIMVVIICVSAVAIGHPLKKIRRSHITEVISVLR